MSSGVILAHFLVACPWSSFSHDFVEKLSYKVKYFGILTKTIPPAFNFQSETKDV